jgi:hypothetical protein
MVFNATFTHNTYLLSIYIHACDFSLLNLHYVGQRSKLIEAHFILKCKVNQNQRESLFNNIELDNEIFLNFSDEQKLVYLLNPASVQHVRVIGFYLKRSLELRDRRLSL